MSQDQTEINPAMQHIGLLNLRVNDMMAQLNMVIKMLVDENTALKKESADLKSKQAKPN